MRPGGASRVSCSPSFCWRHWRKPPEGGMKMSDILQLIPQPVIVLAVIAAILLLAYATHGFGLMD